jgi:hypothetical protein
MTTVNATPLEHQLIASVAQFEELARSIQDETKTRNTVE